MVLFEHSFSQNARGYDRRLPSDGPVFNSRRAHVFAFFLFLLVQKQNKKKLFETSPQLPDPKSDALSIAPLRHFVEFAIKVFFIVSPLAHVAVSESGHH